MEAQARLAAFERMLPDVQRNHRELTAKLEQLKAEGKAKSATFRQYLSNRMTCQYILSLYGDYGLLNENDGEAI